MRSLILALKQLISPSPLYFAALCVSIETRG